MSKHFILVILVILHSTYLFGQQELLPYQSKMADMGEIKMEYMDFGGVDLCAAQRDSERMKV